MNLVKRVSWRAFALDKNLFVSGACPAFDVVIFVGSPFIPLSATALFPSGILNIWICKGFWCFLTGVSKDTFQLFDQKHKDQLTTPSPFSYTSGSSAESTDDISDVSDQDFVENIVSSVASCEGDVDEQYSLWVKNL